MRALVERALRRAREEFVRRRCAFLDELSRRRASRRPRGSHRAAFPRCAKPAISIVVDGSGADASDLRLTTESAIREATFPCEVLDQPEAAGARAAFRVFVRAGTGFTRGWDRRMLEIFALHPRAARIAFGLRVRGGACVDGMAGREVREIDWEGSPCFAERAGAGDRTLYDPRLQCVVPASLARTYHRTTRRNAIAIDSFVPMEDRDAGGRRTAAILRLLFDAGYDVWFVPHQGGNRGAAARIESYGVRVHDGPAETAFEDAAPAFAWIARPELAERYLPLARRAGVRVIYDTVDLHHVRLAGEERVCGHPTGWREMRRTELALAAAAAVTVVTSVEERRLLASEGIDAALLSIVEEPPETIPPFESRNGLLFVGNFTHSPNRDACEILVKTVYPLICRHLPEAVLTIAGFDPQRWSRQFASPGVRVLGHVADLRPIFARARVFVAPLRFGAGVKGKIVQSFAHGVPVVTTLVGVEGMELNDHRAVEVCEPGDGFAAAVARLHRDRAQWYAASAAARACARGFSPGSARDRLATILARVEADALARQRTAHRD